MFKLIVLFLSVFYTLSAAATNLHDLDNKFHFFHETPDAYYIMKRSKVRDYWGVEIEADRKVNVMKGQNLAQVKDAWYLSGKHANALLTKLLQNNTIIQLKKSELEPLKTDEASKNTRLGRFLGIQGSYVLLRNGDSVILRDIYWRTPEKLYFSLRDSQGINDFIKYTTRLGAPHGHWVAGRQIPPHLLPLTRTLLEEMIKEDELTPEETNQVVEEMAKPITFYRDMTRLERKLDAMSEIDSPQPVTSEQLISAISIIK